MYIYSSLSNKLEKFIPLEENKVKIYVCGPTVYNYIHIGNARPIIVFDVLARYFKYLGYDVNFVQNFTDIDDKIIRASKEEGLSFDKISSKYIEAFMEDVENLNLIENITRPKVSENIPEILDMIQNLIDKGYAYVSEGDVLFRVNKFNEYGSLSNQKIEVLMSGARIEKDEKKENPLDFVLWKAKKEGEPYWVSPWSEGRPGWHIECSVLAKKYLGNRFDIHAGGIDLIFPHHENEIAQSRCECCENSFANYWMHNGHLEIDGEKMSKSLGNFTLLRDILKEYDGNVIRFFMLSTHYRKPINFSNDALEISKKTLSSIADSLERIEQEASVLENINENVSMYVKEFETEFKNAMEDDLNTVKAIASIHDIIKKTNKEISINGYSKNMLDMVKVVRVMLEDILGVDLSMGKNNEIEEKLIELLNRIRQDARDNKNYALSDMIRDELNNLGIKITDRKVNK